MIRVLYFAWLRERIGVSSEEVDATGLATAADLVAHLRARGEGYEAAFADTTSLRVAIDQKVAGPDAALAGAREIAFFPPMTGG